ncbi:T9SS type B sorting domain-containing protein [Polaribacter sp.]|uniref:T9SS type B sorting domain-containing protein n=1 Tax=Polaribacter sp. TaxID=1920175 RepID=UPI0025E3BB58|nr:T9SS type B sorting domain-containing protein [Polaribacter sp.]
MLIFFGNANNYFFSSVDTGLQTIYARDTNTCEQSIQINLSVIGFKKYFTPNGDGENDFWNVKGLDKTSFKSIDVQIFDRFGKLIYSITNFDTLGWNGSYNGKNLNANNFWFKAKIVDKDDNEIKESGNFSLIRD